jgi:hypothetical protein
MPENINFIHAELCSKRKLVSSVLHSNVFLAYLAEDG